MSRPPLPEEKKRQQISIRINPDDRDRFEASAKGQGTGIGLEIERLAVAQLDYRERTSEATRELIDAIVKEIGEIESHTGEPWSADLETWAMVAEMLSRGPIHMAHPYPRTQDAEVVEAQEKINAIVDRKQPVLTHLRAHGIHAPDMPRAPRAFKGGLFGGDAVRHASALERRVERGVIEQIEDADLSRELIEKLDELLRLDAEQREAEQERADALRPYYDDERKARDAYTMLHLTRLAENIKRSRSFDIRVIYDGTQI